MNTTQILSTLKKLTAKQLLLPILLLSVGLGFVLWKYALRDLIFPPDGNGNGVGGAGGGGGSTNESTGSGGGSTDESGGSNSTFGPGGTTPPNGGNTNTNFPDGGDLCAKRDMLVAEDRAAVAAGCQDCAPPPACATKVEVFFQTMMDTEAEPQNAELAKKHAEAYYDMLQCKCTSTCSATSESCSTYMPHACPMLATTSRAQYVHTCTVVQSVPTGS